MRRNDAIRRAAFAIPGDLNTQTGGYLYDRRLIDGLRSLGRDIEHVELGGSFPDPTQTDTDQAAKRLAALPADRPVIIDGLALGALERSVLHGMRAPVVALIHHPLAYETGLSPARHDHLYRTERANLALAAHVIVPSRQTASLLMSDYGVKPDRVTIARPGTDRPTAPSAPIEPPLILSVGIQVPRKGHDTLLHALASMTGERWQAVIVGAARDPSHSEHLSKLVRDLKLSDRVRFAGQVTDNDLAQLYQQASVFALATRHEGYGIVFDEAMAHGLPIISCAVGAVPETVAPDAGILVSPDDPQGLAKALRQVLGDSALRASMAAASARAARDLPGWDSTARLVDAALTRVEARANAGG